MREDQHSFHSHINMKYFGANELLLEPHQHKQLRSLIKSDLKKVSGVDERILMLPEIQNSFVRRIFLKRSKN